MVNVGGNPVGEVEDDNSLKTLSPFLQWLLLLKKGDGTVDFVFKLWFWWVKGLIGEDDDGVKVLSSCEDKLFDHVDGDDRWKSLIVGEKDGANDADALKGKGANVDDDDDNDEGIGVGADADAGDENPVDLIGSETQLELGKLLSKLRSDWE